MTSTDWIGVAGVSLILFAYLLLLLKILHSENLVYILMNVAGAGLACLASVKLHYVPFIILEGTWTFVSLLALLKFTYKNYARRKESQSANKKPETPFT